MVRAALSDIMIFRQGRIDEKQSAVRRSGERAGQVEGVAHTKALRLGRAWHVPGTEKRAEGGNARRRSLEIGKKKSYSPDTANTQQSHPDLPWHPCLSAPLRCLPVLQGPTCFCMSDPSTSELCLPPPSLLSGILRTLTN